MGRLKRRVGCLQGLAHVRKRVMHPRQGLGVELPQAFAQFDQVAVEIAGNALDRQLIDLGNHGFEFFLQLFEVARNRRNHDRAHIGIEGDFFRFRVEVQGDVQLPGQQIAGASLGAQAVFDEGTDQPHTAGFIVGVMFQGLEHFLVSLTQALRIDHDADIDREAVFLRVEIEIDRDHLANLHALEFDRSINLEPAQCLIEAQGQVLRLAVGWGQGGLLVLEQFVGIFLSRRLIVGIVFRRTEGNAADQQGRQGFGLDCEAVGADVHIDATGIPETGVLGDVLIIGGVDEQVDVHPLTVRVQRIGHDLADRDLAVVHRRADIQRPQVLGMQGEALARLAVGDGRRVFQALEIFRPGIGLADIGADVIPGQQGVDTRHAASADTRAHHPEFGVFAGEAFRLLGQLDGRIDAFLVIAQFHVRDLTNHHVAVFDLGLVRRQAVTGLEGDGDGRPFLQDAVHHQGNAHQHRDNRHDPDQ